MLSYCSRSYSAYSPIATRLFLRRSRYRPSLCDFAGLRGGAGRLVAHLDARTRRRCSARAEWPECTTRVESTRVEWPECTMALARTRWRHAPVGGRAPWAGASRAYPSLSASSCLAQSICDCTLAVDLREPGACEDLRVTCDVARSKFASAHI